MAPTKKPESSSASSSDLIRQLMDAREADLWHAANGAFVKHVKRDKKLKRAFPTLKIRARRAGNDTFLDVGERPKKKGDTWDWTSVKAFFEIERMAKWKYPQASALSFAHDILVQHLIPTLVAIRPSITREQVLGFLKDAWPATRGPHSAPMFDPSLVQAAHDALRREHRDWGCRGACKSLAHCLGVSPRTVKNLLARSRRKN